MQNTFSIKLTKLMILPEKRWLGQGERYTSQFNYCFSRTPRTVIKEKRPFTSFIVVEPGENRRTGRPPPAQKTHAGIQIIKKMNAQHFVFAEGTHRPGIQFRQICHLHSLALPM